jgi:hypothetical protein
MACIQLFFWSSMGELYELLKSLFSYWKAIPAEKNYKNAIPFLAVGQQYFFCRLKPQPS